MSTDNIESALPFTLETDMERQILSATEFRAGLWYGKPRRGHPEGAVAFHIRDVLENVQKKAMLGPGKVVLRHDLRLIAIVHDTFKYKVDKAKPKDGANHHGAIAARFVEKFVGFGRISIVTETHDDAFNAWNSAASFGKSWDNAERRARKLLERIVPAAALELYLDFFECDNGTGDKTRAPFEWFAKLAGGGA